MKTNYFLKRGVFYFLFFWVLTIALAHAQYPETKTVDVTDTYFGTTISDPYRWLEDIKDSTVLNWMKSQADYTNSVLSQIPNQQTIIDELLQLEQLRKEDYLDISKSELGYVYSKIAAGEQVKKIYFRPLNGSAERLLFDPEKYNEGKYLDVAIQTSSDGKFVLLNLSEKGKESVGVAKILDVQSGKLLDDEIPFPRSSFVKGRNDLIIYRKIAGDDVHDTDIFLSSKLMLHVIGQPISKDIEILSNELNPELNIPEEEAPVIYTFNHSPYMLAATRYQNWNREIYYAPSNEIQSNQINWKPLAQLSDEVKEFILREEDLYFMTSKDAPMYKVVKTSVKNGINKETKDIYTPPQDWKIIFIFEAKDYLLIFTSRYELETRMVRYEFASGNLDELDLPIKTATSLMVPYSSLSNDCWLISFSWNQPDIIYEYDLALKKISDGPFHYKYQIPGIEDLEVVETEVTSHDGTLVPLSIFYNKKMLKKDGSNIGFIYGYGAYGFVIAPFLREEYIPLLNRGVVVAVAHVRGGGTKGDAWYKDGLKTTKPNTWKDFNACAEWLINNKYTSAGKLACSGGSAGGILIGRAITERPDLYKVAIPTVGAMNALRFEFTPNGPWNIQEFGTVKDSIEFFALKEMDAIEHIKQGVQYPAQLVTTGFNDPRVIAWQPAKYAAAMQAVNPSENPVLLDVDYDSGHFGGSARRERYAQIAKEYSFLLWQCGHPDFQQLTSGK